MCLCVARARGTKKKYIYGDPGAVECLEPVNDRKKARVAGAWRVRAQTGLRFREKSDQAWPCGHVNDWIYLRAVESLKVPKQGSY